MGAPALDKRYISRKLETCKRPPDAIRKLVESLVNIGDGTKEFNLFLWGALRKHGLITLYRPARSYQLRKANLVLASLLWLALDFWSRATRAGLQSGP